MKLLVVALNYAPEATGTGKYTSELTQHLQSLGYEIQVVTTPPYYPWWRVAEPYSSIKYKQEIVDGINVLRCPIYVPRIPQGINRILHITSSLVSFACAIPFCIRFKPQVILNIQPSLATAIPAIAIAKLANAPLWLHVQDIELAAADHLEMLPRPLMGILERVEKYIYSCCTGISTISMSIAQGLKARGASSFPEIFPNWVDTQQIVPKTISSYRDELGIPSDKLIAMYSGNLGEKQGLEIIIEAAQILQNNNILFIIAGEGSSKARLQALSKGMANVMYLPFQPHEKMCEFLSLGDIHLVPQKDGVGNFVMPSKLAGILASGRPAIVTANQDDELGIIGNECGITVPPGDSAAFTAAIRWLADHAEERDRLGRISREFAVKHLDSVEIFNRISAFCNSLPSLKGQK